MTQYFIGIMSGTSLDGMDAALLAFAEDKISFIKGAHLSFEKRLQASLQKLAKNQTTSLENLGNLHIQLGHTYAKVTQQLLESAQITAEQITAIGLHGQTICHQPQGVHPFSLQLGSGHVLHQQTHIPVVTDFRSMDIALGGQGAPFAPAFHQALLGHSNTTRVVTNIGGIANISILRPNQAPAGFDTGPGNTLMDLWTQQHLDKTYDHDGRWAKTGTLVHQLLNQMLEEPFFKQSPPKSTGRETFNLHWLQQKLAPLKNSIEPKDIQRTLCQLTACSINDAIQSYAPETQQLLVCGGGQRNAFLMQCLTDLANDYKVSSTDEFGVNSQYMEAMGFAWLAHQRVNKIRIDLTQTTGAQTPCLLGHFIQN